MHGFARDYLLLGHEGFHVLRVVHMVFSQRTAISDNCRSGCRVVEGACALLARILRSALLCLAVLLTTGAWNPAGADLGKAGEYQVKAAFLINFINFVEWPHNALPTDTIIIGVLGRDPSDGAIDALKGKTVKGRQVIVRHYDEPEEARNADLLFICPSGKRALPLILKSLRNRPVLTVGDQQGFVRAGVMINMVLVRKKVGFEINLPASQRAGIRISSQLLKLAKEVVE